MKTRRSILSLIFGAAAAPAAVAVAKAMPEAPIASNDLWGVAANSSVGTVLRVRVPKNYQIFDDIPFDMNPGRTVTLEDWMCQPNQFNPFTSDVDD